MKHAKTIYKMYDPDNNAVYFDSLTELRDCFDLTDLEVNRIFRAKNGCTLNNGDQIIILRK
ncbi:MAG: hypothetical protein ACPG8W_17965 [Candidatus Promineifilaceae bacterium]